MDDKFRPCPACEHGRIAIADIQKGARCVYCHKLIEADFFYSVGIPLLPSILLTLAFKNDYGVIGLILTAFVVFYTFTFDKVAARYIPLKHYGDSD